MPSQNLGYVKCLKEEIKYLREENKNKSDIIETLSEKQHVILKQKANENISITYESNFQAKSIGSITGVIYLLQLVITKTSKIISAHLIISLMLLIIMSEKFCIITKIPRAIKLQRKMTLTIVTTAKTSRKNIDQKSQQ